MGFGSGILQLATCYLWGCGEILMDDKAAIKPVMQVGL